MRTSPFSAERMIWTVGERETGKRADDIRRQHGISRATFTCWKQQHNGMAASKLQLWLERISGRLNRSFVVASRLPSSTLDQGRITTAADRDG